MEYLQNLLIKIPEWWIQLDIPFTLTIGIPILLIVCTLIYINRRAILLVTVLFIILLVGFFAIAGKFCNILLVP